MCRYKCNYVNWCFFCRIGWLENMVECYQLFTFPANMARKYPSTIITAFIFVSFIILYYFSSPEPKDQACFSDHQLSV